MSIFSLKRQDHVNGPNVIDMKVTIENFCAELRSGKYDDGIDPESMCTTMVSFYQYITGTSEGGVIVLPAPANDPDDKYRSMWPEGAKVRTRQRRDSHTSRASSRTSNGRRIPNIDPVYSRSVASSTVSSRYRTVKARFIDDNENSDAREFSIGSIRESLPRVSEYDASRTHKKNQRSHDNDSPQARVVTGKGKPKFLEEDAE